MNQNERTPLEQLNLNYDVLFHARKRFDQFREYIRTGDAASLLQYCRKGGVIFAVTGFLCALPFLLLLPIGVYIRHYGGCFTCVLFFAAMMGMGIYGIHGSRHPESFFLYKHHYLNTVQTVSRNTGYPQRPYVPEEWEIPLTEYSEAAMAQLLSAVNAWGENNIYFICNQEVKMRHSRYTRGAVVMNYCEKGLFIIPIYTQEDNIPKAYLDTTIAVPPEQIKSIRMWVLSERHIRMNIRFKPGVWDMGWVAKRSLMMFIINQHIEGADFHRANVARLYADCRKKKY